MRRTIITALAITILTLSLNRAAAQQPIEGNWLTASGSTARISPCGSAFCIDVTSGEFSGKRIGRMKGSGSTYSGTITAPDDDRQYSGSANVTGNTMKLRGCALRIFCRTQTWKKR